MSWSTSNRAIAAAYAGLGFRVVINETEIIELGSWKNLRFEVSDHSLTNPKLPMRDDLYRGWKEGSLEKLDSDHPFLCGIYAGLNMEAIMKMQAEGMFRHCLTRPLNSPLYRYLPGAADERLKLLPAKHATMDLPLAAAVGLAGLPVTDFDGEPGRRRYLFPDTTVDALSGGLPVSPSQSLPISAFFARIERGKPSLQLGLTHPMHPIVQGYNGAYAYGELQRQINRLKRRILLKDPDSDRRALMPESPSKQFEDELRAHFRIPS